VGSAPADFAWYRGQGCASCSYTGYRGRMILSELWTPNDADIVLINRGAPFEEVRRHALKSTLPMAEDAAEKLCQGRTNLEELIRALPHSALRQLQLGAICRGAAAACLCPRDRPANLGDYRRIARSQDRGVRRVVDD